MIWWRLPSINAKSGCLGRRFVGTWSTRPAEQQKTGPRKSKIKTDLPGRSPLKRPDQGPSTLSMGQSLSGESRTASADFLPEIGREHLRALRRPRFLFLKSSTKPLRSFPAPC
jgi:hypothetical protein